jgi:hypothetical protein
MSDPNELPDYDYADDDKEEAKNHDADGKKYVKLHFPTFFSAFSSESRWTETKPTIDNLGSKTLEHQSTPQASRTCCSSQSSSAPLLNADLSTPQKFSKSASLRP